jgi:hypothetical protein
MNRLKDLACYLSGPIDFAEDMGSAWRDNLTPILEKMNIKVFNPLKHSFYGTQDLETVKRPKMDELLANGDFVGLRNEMKEINHWDLRSLDLSSFMIVNYNIETFMCGTHEEIFTGNRQSKPVLLMVGDKKSKLPKWMYGRFPPEHMFESWDELVLYLRNINSCCNYEFTEADNKRWLFFDGPHMG